MGGDGGGPTEQTRDAGLDVTFWGVRGSIPVPGGETTRYGGNSSCLEVRAPGRRPLVLDCGTGARELGQKLAREHQRDVDVLFSHLHVDHLIGLPFFLPLYTPGSRVRIGVPAYSPEEAERRIARYLDGTFHPVRLRDIPCDVTFHPTQAARRVDVEGFEISAVRLNHPGGALGYRITADNRTFAYVTDTAPFARPGEGVIAGEGPTPAERRLLEFLRGCHVVVYDTMFDRDAYLEKMTWGHSYPEYAVALCHAAGVERLVLFHHLPEATDAELDARAARFAEHTSPRVTVAAEGDTLTV